MMLMMLFDLKIISHHPAILITSENIIRSKIIKPLAFKNKKARSVKIEITLFKLESVANITV